MSSHIYGIDFGTSNSVLTALHIESKEIVKIQSEHSVLYFQDDEQFCFGKEAIGRYVSNNMKGRLLKSVKTLLPQTSFTFTYIFGKKYTAEDLVALMLAHLKSKTDEYLGEEVTEVVLGRPVVFSEDREKDKLAEKRLLNAARKAGFEKIWFQYEPIAAGFSYEQSIQKPETVLIGDFGGGTSDFTLMKLGEGTNSLSDRRSDILKTGGLHIGGDDFDSSIMWNKLVPYFGYGLKYDNYGKLLDLPVHIFRTLCEWDQMAFLKEGNIRRSLEDYYHATRRNDALKRLMALIDENLGFSLFQAIEQSKIGLSANDLSQIDFTRSLIDIHEQIRLEEFNTFIQKDIEKIDHFLTTFLKEAGHEPEQVQTIFLTGGTSSLSAIQDLFKKRFPENVIRSGDNFNSVAQGLAFSYLYLNS